MYGNCGSAPDARSVFDQTHNPNLYSYNLMIRTYAFNGYIQEAQNLFNKTPNPDVCTWNIILKGFIEHGALNVAHKTFERMPCHNIVSWTAMIAALAHNGCCQEALQLFYCMYAHGFIADKVTYMRALDACSSYCTLIQGQQIHASIVEDGLAEDNMVGTSLISMYGKCGNLADATCVFSRTKKDIICWTAQISACAQNAYYEEALILFSEMLKAGLNPDILTFVCALDACSSLLLLSEGRQMHAAIVAYGLEQHCLTGTALVKYYGKCRMLLDVRSVFSAIAHCDIASWNALLTVLVESEFNRDALYLFWQMHVQYVKADNISYICVLNACSKLSAREKGLEVHMAWIEHRMDGDAKIANALINFYGKCGDLCSAHHVFYALTYRDVVSWNTLISVYLSNFLAKEALILLQDMLWTGIQADNVTFIYAFDACSALADLMMGHQIHTSFVEHGTVVDPMIQSALLKMYGKCKSIHDAIYIFGKMEETDVILWTILIGAHNDGGFSEEALNLFNKMQLKGIQPDSTAYVCVLDACANLAALQSGCKLHDAIQEKGWGNEPIVGSALIHMYGNSGDIEKAESVFRGLAEPNLAIWNAIIAGFAYNGHGKKTFIYFNEMLRTGVKPDEISFVSILTACSHAGWINHGKHCFIHMMYGYKLQHVEEHCVCIVDMLGRAGRLEEAEQIIQHLSLQNVSTAWLSLIGACRYHNDQACAWRAAKNLSKLGNHNSGPLLILAGIFAGR
ncbi:hypothetical protein KP509_03G031200 [Ceratopteris richardii]|nr:hypothetical protein KP509_03G031200 [Ceratopteris richardii]